MFDILYYLTLILPLLRFVSAECDDLCHSYLAALQSCKSSSNVLVPGTKMDSNTINCMCTSKSSLADMNACLGCTEANPTNDFNYVVSNAWVTTCNADAQFGVKQAALCWQSQPDIFIPCISNTSGGGSEGGSTNGGSRATTTSSSGGTTSSSSR